MGRPVFSKRDYSQPKYRIGGLDGPSQMKEGDFGQGMMLYEEVDKGSSVPETPKQSYEDFLRQMQEEKRAAIYKPPPSPAEQAMQAYDEGASREMDRQKSFARSQMAGMRGGRLAEAGQRAQMSQAQTRGSLAAGRESLAMRLAGITGQSQSGLRGSQMAAANQRRAIEGALGRNRDNIAQSQEMAGLGNEALSASLQNQLYGLNQGRDNMMYNNMLNLFSGMPVFQQMPTPGFGERLGQVAKNTPFVGPMWNLGESIGRLF